MCRSIKPLNNLDPPVTHDEVHAAALQYVRKVAGTRAPSRANAEAFDRAVHEIAHATEHLLASLSTTAEPRTRRSWPPWRGPGSRPAGVDSSDVALAGRCRRGLLWPTVTG